MEIRRKLYYQLLTGFTVAICLITYVVCEIISQAVGMNYHVEIIALFVGTIGIGGFTISQQQYDKSLGDLTEKTGYKNEYPDGQVFMAAYNKAERIVKQYEWELAEWKQQVEEKPAEEKKPPERRSVLEKLHRIRDEAQKPQKRSYRDRDER